MNDKMNELDQLRQHITQIDAKIIELIAKRQKLIRKVGDYKRKHGLAIFCPEREALLREFHDTVCEDQHLPASMIAKVFEVLIEESRKTQQDER